MPLETPITVPSLKEEFIRRFENEILSGNLKPGERLPAERDLAKSLGVSRPVVHEGLVDLAAKGLVTMTPRRGSHVNDFRKEGSLELLVSLFNYREGKLDRRMLDDLLRMRYLFETDIAELAARNAGEEDESDLRAILHAEEQWENGPKTAAEVVELDYRFHLRLALASRNLVYPLMLNSLRKLYEGILEIFYSDESVIPPVFAQHRLIADAVLNDDAAAARGRMGDLLQFASTRLGQILDAEPTHD